MIEITLRYDTNCFEIETGEGKNHKKKAAMRGCGLPGMPANRH
jgi:hypothetical protein